mgnify:CR=1 FL=1
MMTSIKTSSITVMPETYLGRIKKSLIFSLTDAKAYAAFNFKLFIFICTNNSQLVLSFSEMSLNLKY